MSFQIVNFSHMDSNILSKPAYRVVILKLFDFCNYQDFVYRSKLLTTRLLKQGYVYQTFVCITILGSRCLNCLLFNTAWLAPHLTWHRYANSCIYFQFFSTCKCMLAAVEVTMTSSFLKFLRKGNPNAPLPSYETLLFM